MFPHKENVKYYLYCLYFTKLIKKKLLRTENICEHKQS